MVCVILSSSYRADKKRCNIRIDSPAQTLNSITGKRSGLMFTYCHPSSFCMTMIQTVFQAWISLKKFGSNAAFTIEHLNCMCLYLFVAFWSTYGAVIEINTKPTTLVSSSIKTPQNSGKCLVCLLLAIVETPAVQHGVFLKTPLLSFR